MFFLKNKIKRQLNRNGVIQDAGDGAGKIKLTIVICFGDAPALPHSWQSCASKCINGYLTFGFNKKVNLKKKKKKK